MGFLYGNEPNITNDSKNIITIKFLFKRTISKNVLEQKFNSKSL
jgi:hypothetical protein